MIPRLSRRDPRNQAFSRLASECQGPAPWPLHAAGRKAEGSEGRASHLPHPTSWECPGTSPLHRKLCSSLSVGHPRGEEEEVGEKHKKSLDDPTCMIIKTGGQAGTAVAPPWFSPQGPALGIEVWPHGQDLLAGGLKMSSFLFKLQFLCQRNRVKNTSLQPKKELLRNAS